MVKKSYDVPILYMIFNRPAETRRSFEAIRNIKPRKLFISSDAPRRNNKKDKIYNDEVKRIVSKIDWPCKVKRLYRSKNLGCKLCCTSAVTWFFKNVEKGIIIEDDCLVSEDFFRYMKEILEKYRNDERVMHVAGDNFLNGWRRDEYSYYFSKYPFMWGWGTWRRAWAKYDINTKLYPEIKRKGYFKDLYRNWRDIKTITSNLDLTYYKNFDTWDYQWVFSIMINNALVVVPNKNLVQNIGFENTATHTKYSLDNEFHLPLEKIKFPLKHPPYVIRDHESDRRYSKWLWKIKLRNFFLKKSGLLNLYKA
ncbi:MAG: nucleotide-diphospho-sugar transferase [Nanoarchaeota archaeon]|nr:nucleotide-diphospho-sugar transferase [Nanoarchaeota archaeon]